MDTRRRSACDLVKALIKQFEGPVIQNFSQYVQAMLVEYGKDPRANWKCKDTAIYLVTTLAARAQTQAWRPLAGSARSSTEARARTKQHTRGEFSLTNYHLGMFELLFFVDIF